MKIKRERSSSMSFPLDTDYTAAVLHVDSDTSEPGFVPVKKEASDLLSPSSPKRQRLVFDGVEILARRKEAMKAASTERKLSKAEMKAEIDAMRNPKVKKDIRNEFSVDTIYRRLATIRREPYPINLPPLIRDAPVKRFFMARTYGGSPVDTFPRIAAHRLAEHGYDAFMYLKPDYNPFAPQVPGYPGQFYECCDFPDGERAKVRRLLVLLGNGWWLYMGQYRLARAESLTKAEWNAQTSVVKVTWGDNICEKAWGKTVRARIALRKRLHRNPNATELASAIKDKGNDYKDVTPEQVIRAYNRGEERISVWTMECVGYDSVFQREIVEKFQAAS